MTLLCLDVRNSQTVVGVFEGDRLTRSWRVASLDSRTADEWHLLLQGLLAQCDVGPVQAVALACTVPAVLHEMRLLLERQYAECAVSIVEPGTRTGVSILMDNPARSGRTASSTRRPPASCTRVVRASSSTSGRRRRLT